MMRPDDADFLPRWAPGTRQVYSNVGYTVLQKIIEVKSGKSYADYIKQMTAQMGVTFAIGRSDPANALPNEWTYYDSPGASTISGVYWSSKPLSTPVPRSYIYDMNTMLGHGGWVASPQELVKFASKMDSTAGNPWITWKTFRSMMNRPTGATNPSFYGFNWGVDPLGNEADDKFHFAHGGSLSGSKNLFLKGMYERKLSVAFLFNSSDAGGDLGVTLGKLIEGLDNKGVLGNLALSGTLKTQ